MPQPKSRKIAVLGYRSVGKCLDAQRQPCVLYVVCIRFVFFPACRRFVRDRVRWMSPHARAASSLPHAFKHELKYVCFVTYKIVKHTLRPHAFHPKLVFRMWMLLCRCAQASVRCQSWFCLYAFIMFRAFSFCVCVQILYTYVSTLHTPVFI